MFSQQKKKSLASKEQEEASVEGRKGKGRKEKCLGPSIFITKTFEILQNNFYASVVSWNAEGTHFVIHDIDRFEQEVLPIYFRHRKFSSFVRQLNMYDFHKIRNETNKNIFEHKEFRRDHSQSLRNIKRKGCGAQRKCETNHQPHSRQQIFESEGQFNFEHFEEQNTKPNDNRLTLETIHHYSVAVILQTPIRLTSPDSEEKEKAMNDFVNTLPEGISSEEEIRTIIAQLKKKNLAWLTSKHDVHKVIKKIKRTKMIQQSEDDGLEDLSIEEEIMAENIDKNIDKNGDLSQPQSEVFHSEIWQNGSTGLVAMPGGEEWFYHQY